MTTAQISSTSFGEILKKLRKRAKLTQAELEAKTGLHRSYIAQLENNYQKTISIRTLGRLAKGLGVDDGDLLKASGYITKPETPFIFFTHNRDAKDITPEQKKQADKVTKNFLQYVQELIENKQEANQDDKKSK